jgi:CBS domain containing-hemolysin-like protein
MIAIALIVVGATLAAGAMAVAVGGAAVRRVDLYRWVVQERPGAAAAGAILNAPWRILRAANGLATVGLLVAALGLAQFVARLPAALAATTVLLIAVPLALVLVYAVPRAIGRRWPETVVRRAVPWLDRLAQAATPLIPEPVEGRTRAALTEVLQSERADEALETGELTVLSGVLAFAERPVREVMTPRTDIVAVREGAALEEIARLIAESGYSRIPVYRDSLDNIVGMVYAFDLLKIEPASALPVRPVVTAPASKRCADLLFDMQRQRRQFAVVLDEYGGTAGIATFEDLLEELVGEIFDEYDGKAFEEVPPVELIEASGTMPVDDIEARFDVAFPVQVETVGGLLARVAGRIPRTGERFVIGGLEFDVLSATPSKVERVLVRRGAAPVTRIPLGGDV